MRHAFYGGIIKHSALGMSSCDTRKPWPKQRLHGNRTCCLPWDPQLYICILFAMFVLAFGTKHFQEGSLKLFYCLLDGIWRQASYKMPLIFSTRKFLFLFLFPALLLHNHLYFLHPFKSLLFHPLLILIYHLHLLVLRLFFFRVIFWIWYCCVATSLSVPALWSIDISSLNSPAKALAHQRYYKA